MNYSLSCLGLPICNEKNTNIERKHLEILIQFGRLILCLLNLVIKNFSLYSFIQFFSNFIWLYPVLQMHLSPFLSTVPSYFFLLLHLPFLDHPISSSHFPSLFWMGEPTWQMKAWGGEEEQSPVEARKGQGEHAGGRWRNGRWVWLRDWFH